MDDYLKEALEIVKAQASVRTMAEEEIASMVRRLADSIRGIAEGVVPPERPARRSPSTPKRRFGRKASSAWNPESLSRF